jgi:hypothetical protein
MYKQLVGRDGLPIALTVEPLFVADAVVIL